MVSPIGNHLWHKLTSRVRKSQSSKTTKMREGSQLRSSALRVLSRIKEKLSWSRTQ